MAQKYSVLLLAVAMGILLGKPSTAFKPYTHLWVGQQVLNDIADGCLELLDAASCITIEVCVNERNGVFFPWTQSALCRKREYRVAEDVVNALKRFPAEYRMGHIGPDAFPDFVVGQLTTHPGLKDGWKTDDWLQWLLRKRQAGDGERAFIYGYLGHAAGDMFAHTYVNTYAGDIFLLTDVEQTVERRHFALEDFIDRHTPPIKDIEGRNVPTAALLRVPDSFVADQLILNEDVNGQYLRSEVIAFTPHLLAMHSVVRTLQESIHRTNFAEIEWKLPLRIPEREREIESEIENAAREVDSLASPLRMAKDHVDAAQHVLQEHDRRIAEQAEAVKAAAAALEEVLDQRGTADELRSAAPEIRAKLQKDLEATSKRLDSTPAKHVRTIKEEVCKKLRDPFGLIKKACKMANRKVEEVNKAHEDLKKEIDGTKKKLLKLDADLERAKQTLADAPRLEAERRAVKDAAAKKLLELDLARKADSAGQKALDIASKTLADLEARRRELLERIAKLRSARDLLRGLPGAVGQIRDSLRGWNKDARSATAAYVDAGRRAMLTLVDKDSEKKSNMLDPYREWKTCWSPAFMGIPSQLPGSGCVVARSVDELKQLVAQTRKDARDAFGQTGGWIVDPLGKLEEEIQKALIPAVERAGLDLTHFVAGKEWGEFAEILVGGSADRHLNKLFGTDESPKNLLLIPDIASRARCDMAVRDGVFSETEFAAAYNAVVLSKLALLDPAELNRLAADSGWWGDSHWGDQLYDEKTQSNVLLRAVKSIDGDHAWSPVAPPRPRRVGEDHTPKKERSFGRPRPDGFRFWMSCKARKLVFPGIFHGPLNDFLDLVPKDYPYRPTPENPFPMIISDCPL